MSDLSRVEDILESIVNSETYQEKPFSRVEALLLQVKEIIGSGGGGGTPVNTYSKTEIDQMIAAVTYEVVTLTKDGLMSKDMLSELNVAIEELDILLGTGDGSISKIIATEIAKIVADAPEAYDTLEEIAAWILDHPEDTAAMNLQIQKNKEDIETLVDELNNFESLTDAEVAEILAETSLITRLDFSDYSAWNGSASTPTTYWDYRLRNTDLIELDADSAYTIGLLNSPSASSVSSEFDNAYVEIILYNGDENTILYSDSGNWTALNSLSISHTGRGFSTRSDSSGLNKLAMNIKFTKKGADVTDISSTIKTFIRSNLFIKKEG